MKKKLLQVLCVTILTAGLPLLSAGCTGQTALELSGTVESTRIEANSEVSGKITEVYKEEGDSVKQGDILAKVDPSAQEISVKQQEAVVTLKKAKLDELKAGSRAEQIHQAEAAVKAAKARLDELEAGSRPEEIKQAAAAVDTAKTTADSAKINYDYLLDKYNRTQELYRKGSVSEDSLADAKFRLETAGKQLDIAREQLKSSQYKLQLLQKGATSQAILSARANYEQAQAQLDLYKNGSTSQAIRAAEADLEQSAAALDLARLNLSRCEIKSPVDGTYLSRNANTGDMVTAGTSIGTVSNLTELWVRMYIPQKYLNRISLNQEVQLTSSALPGETVKGRIAFISGEAEFTPKNVETKEAKENLVFRFKIRILDHLDRLKPGMSLDLKIPDEAGR